MPHQQHPPRHTLQRRLTFPGMCCVVAAVSLAIWRAESAAAEPTAEAREFFEKSIRPLLVSNCFKCHSAAEKQKGGLLLDSRAGLLEGGDSGPAVVPGKPDESRLIHAIRYTEEDLKMPPRGKLKDAEISALTKWVEMGAPWPESPAPKKVGGGPTEFNLAERARQWAFQPLQEVPPPPVKDAAWGATLIDAFILARLEGEGLTPAPAADKRTLLRRVTYDLIGLPPTPAEIDAFLADSSPEAFATVVNRLLDSPQYGERWARHWLDLVRFAETGGHEFDFELPNAYAYRDYVIRAFNADVPYNDFVREHLAGDLLHNPRRHPTEKFNESIIGTGFFWLGEGKHSPVDIREEEATRVDNQIDVLAKTFLGLTVSCARCHDHKFDAISTKDYYALAGFIRSSHYQQAEIDDPEPLNRIIEQIRKLDLLAKSHVGIPHFVERDGDPFRVRVSLHAVRDVLSAQKAAPHTISDEPPAGLLFEDFEKGTYEGWTITGTAFGAGPNQLPLPEYQGEVGSLGKGLVNTHSALADGKRTIGDDQVGTLTSKVFKLQQPAIRFRIGGGAHAGKTCLNFLVGGKVQRTVTGKNSNRMTWGEFDVREFVGQEAQLQIVDDERGGWGHIAIDHIVFAEQLSPPAEFERQLIQTAADKHHLDIPFLKRFVDYLRQNVLGNPLHVLYPWAVLAELPPQTDPKTFKSARDDIAQRLQAQSATADQALASSVFFEDFMGNDYGAWIVSGTAFGQRPAQPEEVQVQSAIGRSEGLTSSAGVAHSGIVSSRLRGQLRSQTFVLDQKQIWYRMAGHACQVNLVIDEFHQIRNPIYGGLTISPKDRDTFSWQVQDVSMWKGHRAFIEIVDPGDGYIAVDRIVLADHGPPPERPNPLVVDLLKRVEIESIEELDEQYAKLFTGVGLSGVFNGSPTIGRSESSAALANWLLLDSPFRRLDVEAGKATSVQPDVIASLRKQRAELEAQLPVSRRVLALVEGTPENEHVFIRGSHKNLGEEAPRRLLEALGGARQPLITKGSGRLELAEAMLAPADPLLPRVIVNRIWQHHFGEGIVRTPDDFGQMGQPPTHPELLDYLAREFVKEGWSIKNMHRRMLLTNTYQMSSQGNPAAEAADPQDRLLHRMPVRRLEAECIRDAVLAVSGRLDRSQYGPGVLPHLSPYMVGRGRPGSSGALDGDGRRSIYGNVRRNFLNPLFLAFDYPIPFTTIGRRGVSNVPAQALALMNNPFVLQQAEIWSKRALVTAERPPAERIQELYNTAFARLPTDSELQQALEFVEAQSRAHGAENHPQAWADLCHVLLNVKEFIFVN